MMIMFVVDNFNILVVFCLGIIYTFMYYFDNNQYFKNIKYLDLYYTIFAIISILVINTKGIQIMIILLYSKYLTKKKFVHNDK